MTIEEIAEHVRTQDNRMTENTIFLVQQNRREYGKDDASEFVWVDEDFDELLDLVDTDRLDKFREETGLIDHPDGSHYVGYVDHWDFVTACFTEQGCKDYIAANGHNLTETRIYVAGGHRNSEWAAMREFLKSYKKEENAIHNP